VLVADVAGYSRLMAEDQDATVRTVTAYREEVELLVRQHQGRLVDFTGDEFLAEFPTALESVRCAVEIQRVLGARNEDLPAGRRMEFRMGIHLGDVAATEGRLYGDGVNIAARPDPVRVYRVEIVAEPARPETSPRSLRRAALAVGVVVLLGALAVAGWRILAVGAVSSTAAPIRSIAVLPLENLSGDPEQEYFADGMTDTLIGELAKIGSLRVTSRTSVMQYKGARRPLPQIAAELGVDAILEGTVFQAGDRVRITVQLIRAQTDEHLWADRYDREVADVLLVHADVARAVANEVRAEITPDEERLLARPRRVDPDAFDAYLKGLHYTDEHTLVATRTALEFYESALEIEPDFAEAHAAIARLYILSAESVLQMPFAVAASRAKQAATRALELDDGIASAHASLAFVLWTEYDWMEAEREFERALELDPSDPWTLDQFSYYLGHADQHQRSIELGARARAVAPTDPWFRISYAWKFIWARDFARALREFRASIQLDPDFPQTHLGVAFAHRGLRQHDEAVEAAQRFFTLAGVGWAADAMRRGYAEGGANGAYARFLEVALELDDRDQLAATHGIANAFTVLGEFERAFEWLARHPLHAIPADPSWDPLRDDPRFDALLRKINWPGLDS
jgi:TolB-like protein/Tfp pilus assembly protein PilF